jgi:outer membrane cobalamin receptor
MKYKIRQVLFSVLLVNVIGVNLWAQSTIKIYGTVVDSKNGSSLFGADIIVEGTGSGASTDERGRYQLENLLTGVYDIKVSYTGYKSQTITDVKVLHDQPVQLNFQLEQIIYPLNEIIVSADRHKEHPSANIHSITSEDIEHSNFQSVGEVLDQVPGLEIQSAGGAGSAKKISIRGCQTNQVLVLLDGVPLNDELNGDVDLSQIPVNIIEKIEVHKGGNSPLFGSGAIGGVVNIITRSNFKNELKLNNAYGSFNLFNVEPAWSGNFKNFNFLLSFNYTESKNDFPYTYKNTSGDTVSASRINSDLTSSNFFGRVNYQRQAHSFALQAQRMQSERGIPGQTDRLMAYARANNTRYIIGTSYKGIFKKSIITLDFRYLQSFTKNSNLYPPDTELRFRGYIKYHYEYTIKNLIARFNVEYMPADWLRMTMGYIGRRLNYNDEDFISSSKPINETNDLSHGFFIHQEWKAGLGWYNTQIVFSPVIRYNKMNMDNDEQQRFEHQWSPGAGLFLSAGNIYKLYLKANISRSFRAPTFADLFYQDVRVRIEGKSNLLPEKSVNMDIGLGCQFSAWGKLAAEITHFKYTIEDLIVWKVGSFKVFRPSNTDAEISGQEYALEFRTPKDFVVLNLGYTNLQPLIKSAHETTNNKIIPYRPQSSFKAGFNINYKRWLLALNYRNLGKRFVNEANRAEMPPYRVWDINLSCTRFFRPLEVICKFSVFNLMNEKYEIIRDYPLPPREWRLGLTLTY